MAGMKQVVTLPLVLLLTTALASAKVPITGSEARIRELQRERSKLEKTTDPVERAKIGIRISDILLDNVGDSVREGDFTEMEVNLTEYAETIQSAHQALVDSGRNASKKPGGFKDLEMALRQHVRKFEDFARSLNLQRRIPVEQTKDLAAGIRDKLLKALFP
jgi:hypothetical protein